MSCDGKWEEHITVYEDEELRKELGKPTNQEFYPLSDVPEIQAEFIRQLEEEKTAETAPAPGGNEVAKVEAGVGELSLVGDNGNGESRAVATLEQRQQNTLPARDKPERSVRLMKEKGMLRKYD